MGLDAKTKVQTLVYKNRIRLKEFFCDFDKLRSGFITQTQFKSGLSMARLGLSADEMDALVEEYKTPEDVKLVAYRSFCDDINFVFTKAYLEKTPLADVPLVPSELLAPTRYCTLPTKEIAQEGAVEALLAKIKHDCKVRRIIVKPFFDDASKNQNSPLSVNHVTTVQFAQALKNHVAPNLSPAEVALLTEKFESDGMVNYVAFAYCVDTPEKAYDPYTLL